MPGFAATTPRPPRPLARGGTVAVIAPASGYDPGEYVGGVARLRDLGFRVREGRRRHPPVGSTAGSRQERLDELHAAFSDDTVDAVIAVRGGYGVMHLLPGIDWELLAAHPRPLVGLSDLTPLLNAAADRAGLVTVHGPMVVGLGGRTDDASVERLVSLLTVDAPPPPLAADGDVDAWCVSPGRARGRLCGGNLALIAATTGTPFALRTEGRIVLLEEVGEAPYRIDRALTQLRLAGTLDGCAGIAFGEMVRCGDDGAGTSPVREVVRDVLSDLPVPVVWGLPFGHGARNHAFPIGALAEIDASAGRLTFLEPAVSDGPGREDMP